MAVVLSVGDWKLNLPPEVRGVIHGQWTRLKIDAFTHLFIAAKCIFTDYCLFLIQTPPSSLFLDLYNILCFDASHIRKLIFANDFENGNNLNNASVLKISLACSKMPFSWKNLWRKSLTVYRCSLQFQSHTRPSQIFNNTILDTFPTKWLPISEGFSRIKPRSKLLINVLLWLIYANRLSNEKIIADDAIEFGKGGIERKSVDY